MPRKVKNLRRRRRMQHLSDWLQPEDIFWILFTSGKVFQIKIRQNLKARSIILLISGIAGSKKEKLRAEEILPVFFVKNKDC